LALERILQKHSLLSQRVDSTVGKLDLIFFKNANYRREQRQDPGVMRKSGSWEIIGKAYLAHSGASCKVLPAYGQPQASDEEVEDRATLKPPGERWLHPVPSRMTSFSPFPDPAQASQTLGPLPLHPRLSHLSILHSHPWLCLASPFPCIAISYPESRPCVIQAALQETPTPAGAGSSDIQFDLTSEVGPTTYGEVKNYVAATLRTQSQAQILRGHESEKPKTISKNG
jgi:hypothetical protein